MFLTIHENLIYFHTTALSPNDSCVIIPNNPIPNDCGVSNNNVTEACCVKGGGGNEHLECRANCAACQQGVSSNDCCNFGCNSTAPVCCKERNGPSSPFECVASYSFCPAGNGPDP